MGNARTIKAVSSESVGAWNQMGRHGSLMMHGDTVQGLEVSSELAVAYGCCTCILVCAMCSEENVHLAIGMSSERSMQPGLEETWGKSFSKAKDVRVGPPSLVKQVSSACVCVSVC